MYIDWVVIRPPAVFTPSGLTLVGRKMLFEESRLETSTILFLKQYK